MKPLHFAPPAIALAICATLLGSQRNSIRALEREHGLLLAEIATARKASTLGRDQTSGENGKTRSNDWKKIVATLGNAEVRDQIPDMLDMRRLEQLILEMDEAEITAALGEIETFNIPDSSSRELHRMLLDALSDKNPKLVCQQFI